jgi:hypothetical protein
LTAASSGEAGATIAAPRLSQNLGPHLTRYLRGSVGRIAIDHKHLFDHSRRNIG